MIESSGNKTMSTTHYKLPLLLDRVMQGYEMEHCDLETSISKNIELIILTRFGEQRSDPTFGCEIWDVDFELIVSPNIWEEKLRQSLLRSVTAHEHRLTKIEVGVTIRDMERTNFFKKFKEMKKRVDIRIDAVVVKTGEPFKFHTNMFLSPMSID